MYIQQPQDSSQRSAVIAHYNQSSWAHLSSSFGIKNRENHKIKPQSLTDTSPDVCPTQTSAREAKRKDRALRQGLHVEDYKAQGQDMVLGEGTHRRHYMHTSTQLLQGQQELFLRPLQRGSPSPEARAEPEQGVAMSEDGKQDH